MLNPVPVVRMKLAPQQQVQEPQQQQQVFFLALKPGFLWKLMGLMENFNFALPPYLLHQLRETFVLKPL